MKTLRSVWTIGGTAGVVLTAALLAGCGSMSDDSGGVVYLDSAPEQGALIRVNDEPYGTTPAKLEGFRPGRVLVELTKDGYRDAFETVQIPEEGEQRLTIEMRRRVGRVTIESKPPLANVYLNGETPLGQTPVLRAEFPVGRHTYTLELENYEPATYSVMVHEDLEYRYAHELTPKNARLRVSSTPPGALVMINKRSQEKFTPSEFSLRPGDYSVGVSVRGFMVAEQGVRLGPNEEQEVSFTLEEGNAPPGMVLIPAGEFVLGANNAAPDERPERRVHVEAFFIDKYEVTNRQFQEVFPTFRFPEGQENYPVTGVTYQEAVAYADRVRKRLPTEIEWEKAARGTDGRKYPWGDEFDRAVVNSAMSPKVEVCEVGLFVGGFSPYGVADMAGNVMEWTTDWYQAYPGNTEVKAEYGQLYKVLRGGSFKSAPFDLRCSRRHFDRMDKRSPEYGLRCVMDFNAWTGGAR